MQKIAISAAQFPHKVSELRRISEEKDAENLRIERAKNRNRKPSKVESYPPGFVLEVSTQDRKDPRICVLANDDGQYLKSTSTSTRDSIWASLQEALKIQGPAQALDFSQRFGGTVLHFHENSLYKVNFDTPPNIVNFIPGHVEVI